MKTQDAGLSLIEVCLAMLIVCSAAISLAQLFVTAMTAAVAARQQTSASILAAQKVEQLRSLTWRFTGAGVLQPASDTGTDLSRDPAASGGPGLGPSSNSLSVNTTGYVDYQDEHGRWVGTGASPPPTTVFIRRWSITPLPTSPSDSLVLRVLVTTVMRESQAAVGIPRRRLAGDSLVVTVLTRKAW